MKNQRSILSLSALAFAALSPLASAQEVYMSNLANPRGLTFGSDGTLYVAEAGYGGGSLGQAFTGGGGSGTFGLSGGVSSRLGSGIQTKVLTGLPSIAPVNGFEATGPADVGFTTGGQLAVLFGLGAGSTDRAVLGSSGALLGTVAAYSTTSHTFSVLQDYAAREQTENPDGGEINSNPYAMVADGSGFAVADGGSNALWRTGGSTLLPNDPGGTGQESVPTSVIAAKGGGFLVGGLGGGPFTPGQSRIFNVSATGSLLSSTKYGLTSIIDLAYAPDGSLLVEEIFANGLLNGGPGDVKRIRPDGSLDTIISGLITPTSMLFGSDGYLYLTNNALSGSGGQVLRYAYQPVPEPATLGALALGALGVLRRRRGAR